MFFHTMMRKIRSINWGDLLVYGLHFIVSYWFCRASGLTEQCAGLSLWTFFAYLLLADLLDTTIHELGHMVAGLFTGWQCYAVTLLCFRVQWTHERCMLHLVRPSLMSGSCELFPREEPDLNTSALAMLAGGPCATLLAAMLLTPFINAMQPSPLYSFLCILKYLCTLSALLNLMPVAFPKSRMTSDGMKLIQYTLHPSEQFGHAVTNYVLCQEDDAELPECYQHLRDALLNGQEKKANAFIRDIYIGYLLQEVLDKQEQT